MKTLSTLALAVSLLFAAPAFADDAHHPDKASAASATLAAQPAPATVKKMQSNVRKMQAQLDRAGKAKTAEAQQQAMAEHMRTMQENLQLARGMMHDGMDCATMHGKTISAGAPDRLQQLEKRVDVLERAMQGHSGGAEPTAAK